MNLALLAERDLRERGERARLWFEERQFSNRDLHEASLRLAHVLSALGVRHDDRVVVLLPNCPEVLTSLAAIWRVGAVAVPALDLRDFAQIASDCAPKLVITSLAVLSKLPQPMPLTLVVTEGRGEPPAPALSFERALAHSEPYGDAAERAADDLAVILYTSGTTGKPKGVMLSHHNLSASVAGEHRGSTPAEDVRILALPLAHAFGVRALVGSYLFGGRSVLMRRFTAPDALRLIERHRAHEMAGVPSMFLHMLHVEEPYDTSTMKRWLVSSAVMPAPARAAFEARFGGTMIASYGLLEASGAVSAERRSQRKAFASGRALAGVQLKIVDDAGRTLAPEEVGEICTAGEHLALGYYGNPRASAAVFVDGWLHSGDLGYLDAEGYLFVLERKRDLIMCGGSAVYPREVEEVLMQLHGVHECAVVGVPDPLLGEQVCACVVADAALDTSALLAHCLAALPKYQVPRYVQFVAALPRTPTGSLKRGALRAWASKQLTGEG